MRIFEILHIVNDGFDNSPESKKNIEMGISEFFKDSESHKVQEFQNKYRQFETILKNSLQIKFRELEEKEKTQQQKDIEDPSQWLTVNEYIEKKYGKDAKLPSPGSIRNWIRDKRIKGKQISERGYRVHKSELDK